MRNVKLLFLTIGFLLASMGQIEAQKLQSLGDDGIFYLRTSDGHDEYEVDGEITFKAVPSGFITKSLDAGVCFSPKNAGDLIQVTFEDIDLNGTNTYLRLYNGNVEIKYPMPDNYFAQVGKDAKGKTYLSESSDGKFTFGFHSTSLVNEQTGWTIKVKSITPPKMGYKSAKVFLDQTAVNRGGRNQILLGINVETEGLKEPLSLKELNFGTSITQDQLQAYRIYYTGSSKSFNADTEVFESKNVTSSIHVATDITLRGGNNYFWFVADIAPDAVVSSALPISLTSLKIGNELKTPEKSSASSAKVSSDILMQKDHFTYTISSAMNFYDDGGKDGKISQDFEGAITFVPSSADKKIQIDFSKLELFSGFATKNDVFNFYNGKSVDSQNLIATLLKEIETVKSTADDGSLTVTFKSITGVTANGWEAVVSEFIPESMTYNSTEIQSASEESLAAGNTNEKMLLFNIKTTNTLAPLSAEAFKFDAKGTTNLSRLAKAKLYFLGKKADFTTTDLVGEISLSGSSVFEITGDQILVEGDNYFALTYDIATDALSDEEVAATLKNVKLSGTNHAITGSAVAKRKVDNTFKSLAGNHTRIIYGEWIFTDTKSPYNSAYYDYDDKNCIVTFTPAEPGAVAEIDFRAFDVYYANSSYGVKATFEIYSGTTTDSENLLWKLDNANKSKTGPETKLRSTATDGSMTIKFNANTATPYYAGKGWMAVVRPFVNHDMSIKSITAFQDETSKLSPSAKNEEIIGFEVVTEGTLNQLKTEEFKLNLKKSLASVDKVNLLYSGNVKDFSSATPIAELIPTATEVDIQAEQLLPEEKSYFWISYDIKSDIENDQEIDAALVSLKANGRVFTTVDGDPEGFRLTKNEILLANGDNGQVTLSRSLLFYDDGGADNNYSKNFEGQVTFLPASEGQVVKLKFNNFFTASAHYMYVYNGKEVKEENLLYKISTTTTPETILSTSVDGALTVRFVSTSSSTYRGWEIEASSYTLQNLEIKSITTSQVGGSDILRGSNDEALQKIVVHIDGDQGVIKLNKFKFGTNKTTNLTDIALAKLFYTGKTSSFVAENQFGNTATSANLLFSETKDLEIKDAGDYYFWLAYDIAKTATIDNKVSAKLESLSVGGKDYTSITESKIVERTIKSGFEGTYIIGKSAVADYATFADAIAEMKNGVEGAVVFKIESGTYNENILIKGIRGTSAKNTIRFTSASGKNNDVIIKGSRHSAESSYGMFAVDSTSYVTVENMSLIPTDQSYPSNVHIRNISRHFTLRNCILTANNVTSGYSGIKHFYTEAINEDGKNNDYVTLEGNTITGGYVAIYAGGTGYVALTKEKGAIIRNNKIYDAYTKGIYVYDEQDALIENNTIITGTLKNGYQGIDVYRNIGNLIIRNNRIVNKQTSSSIGIELRSEVTGSLDQLVLVYNNSISIPNSTNASSYGMSISDDCSNIGYYNNTIRMGGDAGYIFGFSKGSKKGTNLIIQNNLFQNTTSSPLFGFFGGFESTKCTFKNNAYLLTGSKYTNNGGEADLSAWVAKSGETGAIEYAAEFFSDTDLHLRTAGTLNAALPVSFVTTDIDGKERNATTPTIGAYEYIPFTIGTPKMEEGYPIVQSTEYNKAVLKVKLTQPGKLYSLIKMASETVPSIDDMKLAQTHDLGVAEEGFVIFSDLTELTNYKAYFYMESLFGDKSAIMLSELFTTPAQIQPIKVDLPRQMGRIDAGKSVDLVPTVKGGVYPYTYSWKNAKGEVLSTDSVLTVLPQFSTQYTLTIKDANIENNDYRTDVLVNGKRAVATFDDLYLAPESYWQGLNDEEESVFYSGSYSFSNTYYPDMYTWGGFGYSNSTETNFKPSEFLTQQFRSVTGKGVEGSKNFAVLYTFGSRTEVKVENNPTQGEVIPGVYLTNAAYTMSSIKNGDPTTGNPFTTGDWAKVIFKGTKADGTTSTLDYYFADYRSENVSEHYAIDSWKWVDLSSLGQVTKVSITIDASRKNDMGLTLPAYICMDNFGAADPTPTFATNYPILKETTRNTASFEVKTDKSGTLYKLVRKASDETIPTLADLLASNYDQIKGDKATTVLLSDLSSETEYKAYFVVKSTEGYYSEIKASNSFTTKENFVVNIDLAVKKVTPNSANIELNADQPGKLYKLVRKTSSATAPTLADLITSESVEIKEDNATNVLFTNLSANTEYKAYFVLESTEGFYSAIKTSDSFTTKADFVANISSTLIRTTRNRADLEVKTDQSGKLYQHIQKVSDTTVPSLATMLASGFSEIKNNEIGGMIFFDLNRNTAYKVYFMLESTDGLYSTIVSSDPFTTKSEFDYTLTINDKKWKVEDKYIVASNEQKPLTIKMETADNDVVMIDGVVRRNNELVISSEKPFIRNIVFKIESKDGYDSETYNTTIEKYFAFDDIVKTMWNNTLMLNLKKLKMDGYTITGYQWFKNGEPLEGETAASYSAGPKANNLLDRTATYAVALTTSEGIIHSEEGQIEFNNMQIKAYPNPLRAGETLYIDADVDEDLLTDAVVEVYTISGNWVRTEKVTDRIIPIALPAKSGVYIVKFKAKNGFSKELKSIVK